MDVESSNKGVLSMPRPKTKRTPRAPVENAEVGERLKQIRKRLGVSQGELGEKLGLSQRAISEYEGGRNRLPVRTLLKISEIFEISLKEFIGKNGQPSNRQKDHQVIRRRIFRRLNQIEQLPRRDQQAVFRFIDNAVTATNGRRVA